VNARTRLAKAVFWLSGQLARIRTPQLTHRFIWDSPDAAPRLGDAQRRWLPCRMSLRLMDLSTRIDPVHWDHWAGVHPGCDGEPCTGCGGVDCPHQEWDEEKAA
jgi:hypothetical protein